MKTLKYLKDDSKTNLGVFVPIWIYNGEVQDLNKDLKSEKHSKRHFWISVFWAKVTVEPGARSQGYVSQ